MWLFICLSQWHIRPPLCRNGNHSRRPYDIGRRKKSSSHSWSPHCNGKNGETYVLEARIIYINFTIANQVWILIDAKGDLGRSCCQDGTRRCHFASQCLTKFSLNTCSQYLKYMTRTMENAYELWRLRKLFTLQTASCGFLTYVFCLPNRTPAKFHLSLTSGLMTMTEMAPS